MKKITASGIVRILLEDEPDFDADEYMAQGPSMDTTCLSLGFEWVEGLGCYYKDIGRWIFYVKACTLAEKPVARLEIGYQPDPQTQYCMYVQDLERDPLLHCLPNVVDAVAKLSPDEFDPKNCIRRYITPMLAPFVA